MQDSVPTLKLAYLEEGLPGSYDSEKDVVTLSYNYIIDSEADGYSLVQVLFHEYFTDTNTIRYKELFLSGRQ